jgi:hypothetical protein
MMVSVNVGFLNMAVLKLLGVLRIDGSLECSRLLFLPWTEVWGVGS